MNFCDFLIYYISGIVVGGIIYLSSYNFFPALKGIHDFTWLIVARPQCLQQATIDLNQTYQNFFKSGFGFPKFKKKGERDSFRFPDPKQFSLERVSKKRGMVKLPKICWIIIMRLNLLIGPIV